LRIYKQTAVFPLKFVELAVPKILVLFLILYMA